MRENGLLIVLQRQLVTESCTYSKVTFLPAPSAGRKVTKSKVALCPEAPD